MIFSFGKNWKNYLKSFDSGSLESSKKSLDNLIKKTSIKSGNFLDIGSGSGAHSLSARIFGFNVYSFDYDVDSVNASKALKERYYKEDENWIVKHGSILDSNFINNLINKFDIVYSWGVLHHTGNMMLSLENASKIPKKGGYLIISIYNDQGFKSKYWKIIKKLYNLNFIFRYSIITLHAPYFLILVPLIKIILEKKFYINRGMNLWTDYLDWIGGYPFEVAKTNKIVNFFEEREYKLVYLNNIKNRLGCNEFIFKKINRTNAN